MRLTTNERRGAWMCAVLFAALGSACSGSTGGSGEGGTTGTGSTTSTTECHGDQASWDSLTAGPFTCTHNSDCCVIVNGCINAAQVVSAANKNAAEAAWPYCENECTACIPPAIVVGCNNGVCTGTEIDFPDASTDLLSDHCGVDGPAVTLGKLSFTCGGG
jgi:hypothetical protein